MAFPIPKFEIGQTVWTADATDEPIQAVCPDCNDTRKWTATSPVGEAFEFPCPRCTGHDVHKLRHQKAVYRIRKLTIGSIRVDSSDAEFPVSYMCQETGVGSGTVWRESRLAADEACAADIGRTAVAEREVWRAKQIDQHERNNGAAGTAQRVEAALRYHTFTTAAIVKAQSEAWRAGYRFENLCNAVVDSDKYGDIDAPTLDKLIAGLAADFPMLSDHRDAVMADREKARKAAA